MANRRTTLIVLGGLIRGAGSLLGTGAFSTVTAERSVSLRTADDADAFLAFEAIDEECVDASDGTIGFELLAESETTFAELVDVRNNGTRTVTLLRFDFDADGADQPDPRVEDALRVVSDGTDIGNATTELPPEN